ncbi:MAG: NAD-dependent epimerase/dehydratase [Solimicrobium sp.]|nr:NAD-dependent epimerase/dehydratase [Solimicrobium sp.]
MDCSSNQKTVGLLGATSFVGSCLLQQLVRQSRAVVAFSRREIQQAIPNVQWKKLSRDSRLNLSARSSAIKAENKIPFWICLAPISSLPEYFELLEMYGVQRIVVLSSTSRYTKNNSSDPTEQRLALRLAEAETLVQTWAEARNIEWIILRPTLIYGLGRDKNISEIAHFIRRFGLFPLLGKASGLRQPIHIQDVADACLSVLQTPASVNRAYNISGAEIIPYREMITRIFSVMGKRPQLLSIPLWLFKAAVRLLRCLPRYRKWSSAMAERMNCDMVFDHIDAERDFGFKPRCFKLTSEDIPA